MTWLPRCQFIAADGTFVDLEMVRQGWRPVEYPPDLRHAAEAARAAAVEAPQNGSGFWSGTSPDGAMSYGITVREANVRKEPSTDADQWEALPGDSHLHKHLSAILQHRRRP